jgi:uncharacterized membrane protein
VSLAAIRVYDVVLFIHIGAAVLAFGPTFGYAFFQVIAERRFPRSVPAVFSAMSATNRYLVTPAALLLIAAGIYLTADVWDFGYLFVTVGLIVWLALMGLTHGFFIPHETRARELAERDIAASGDGEVTFSDEYWAISKRYAQVGSLAGVLVLLAVFFMTVKP